MCGASTPKRRRTPLLAACVLLAALALAACSGGEREPSPTPSGAGTAERVTYQTADGLRIIADFYAPQSGGSAPAVLLLHQFNGNRAQWADLIPDLLAGGYAVLAPDLRSFGESTTIIRDGEDAEYRLQNLDDMLFDVAAAIIYLSTRTEVEADAIAVVGASVGGNLAYVASGAFPEVRATVSISPNANPQGGALLGSDISDFSPRAVLFLSDQTEAADAETLAASVAEPVDVIIYEGEAAHGVQLLANLRAKPDILGWLTANLALGE